MYTPLKLGVITASTMIILALLYPLVIFAVEILSKPENMPKLSVNATAINETHTRLVVTVSYNGSIVLKDFSVELGNVTTLYYGDLTAGNHTREAVVPREAVENGVGYVVVRFSVAGLYPMEFRESVRR